MSGASDRQVVGELRGLSSMATQRLLAQLSNAIRHHRSVSVQFESAGGVEVARRIRAGARADVVVLSAEALSALDDDGLLVAGTLRPLFVSDVVAAVPEHTAPLTLSTEDELRARLIGAGRIAYSTGPSGSALVELITRWGLVDVLEHKLVQAEPGTPVARLLADGDADLGFQQRSELSDVAGVRVLGPLPDAAAIRSTFSGAILADSTNLQPACEVLDFLTSADAEAHVLAAGMTFA